ncbi:MAG: glycosyltransferase [Rhodospirillum sp.]|nr:glycosyltransferase [Rhodospirillum sp.]MCF8489884.1 glycosyltransferase [Rhodospirillum sp.]MCF8501829.1 glycosyltransferase [Rhodospirillum sp.]
MALEISVIIPAYRTQALLTDCLGSLDSEIEDIAEVIVIDDGSEPPLSVQTSERVKPKLVTARLNRNQGVATARQWGIDLARGDWISFLDSDDLCLPGRFKNIRAFIDDHPEIGLFGGEFTVVSGEKETYGHLDPKAPEEIFFESLVTCPFLMSTLTVRTDLARSTPMNTDYRVGDDYLFMVDCLWKAPGAYLKAPLAQRLTRPDSLINSHPDRDAEYRHTIRANFSKLGLDVADDLIPLLAMAITNEEGFLDWARQDPRHMGPALASIELLFSALDALRHRLPYGGADGLAAVERRVIALGETLVMLSPIASVP